jgi:hypothetical protein
MPVDDEFAEFETDEASFDAMMNDAHPAELVVPPPRVVAAPAQDAVYVSIGSAEASRGWATTDGPVRLTRFIQRQDAPTEVAS